MKAIVSTKYGPPEVLQRKEVAKLSSKEDGVLVKLCNNYNLRDMILRGLTFPLRRVYGLGKNELPYRKRTGYRSEFSRRKRWGIRPC
jgi:hypothetical protein